MNTWMQEDDLPYFVPMSDEARTSGRPQTGRFHNEMDMKWQPQKNRCSVCRRPRHNKATCSRKKGLEKILSNYCCCYTCLIVCKCECCAIYILFDI